MWGQADELRIELDEEGRTFRPGDVVTGEVYVSVERHCDCRQLVVYAQWRTNGKHRATSGRRHSERLFSGEWEAGTEQRYPFSLQLPDGPCTYRGERLEVDWVLGADLEIPHGYDPETEEVIEVDGPVEGGSDSYRMGDPRSSGYDQVRHEHYTRNSTDSPDVFGALIVGAMLVGMGGSVIWGGLQTPVPTLPIIAGVVLIAIGAFAIFKNGLDRLLTRVGAGKIEADVEDSRVAAGENVELKVGGTDEIDKVSATLRAVEYVLEGKGKRNALTMEDMAIGRDEVLHEDFETVIESTDGTYRLKFLVPENASPSFYAVRNQVLWWLDVEVDVAGAPDWSDTVAVDVVPPTVESDGGSGSDAGAGSPSSTEVGWGAEDVSREDEEPKPAW